ncbi:hypothetical protein AB0D40_41315 [Streptomyces massasporeus]|uniref:hypothetical protein n=1 Tax=Streptomyces massasporeus TaxID=67324 RepID=UPI0033FA757C
MTDRRTLGSGPQDARSIRASQADLLDALPGVRLPDLAQLRERGVLGANLAATPRSRRTLGAGSHRGEDVPSSD